jgi:hypothetical protein
MPARDSDLGNGQSAGGSDGQLVPSADVVSASARAQTAPVITNPSTMNAITGRDTAQRIEVKTCLLRKEGKGQAFPARNAGMFARPY